jgi:hypothetical protein
MRHAKSDLNWLWGPNSICPSQQVLAMSSRDTAEGNLFSLHIVPVSSFGTNGYGILLFCLPVPKYLGGQFENRDHSGKPSISNQQENVQQFRVQFTMKVPPSWQIRGYHSRVSALFLSSYKKEQWFQMTQQGVGTDMGQSRAQNGM